MIWSMERVLHIQEVIHSIPKLNLAEFTQSSLRSLRENRRTIALTLAVGLSLGVVSAFVPSCTDQLMGLNSDIIQTADLKTVRIGNLQVQKIGDEYFPIPESK